METRTEEALPSPRARAMPKSDIAFFCETVSLAEAAEAAAMDRRMARANVSVEKGGIGRAVAVYGSSPSPNLVVVESGADGGRLLERLQALALECVAGTRVIVVGHRNDVGLYRDLLQVGVSDYLVAPLTVTDLIEAATRCLQSSEKERLGRIIAFIGAKGGSGSSTVAHNVASAMARQSEAGVLLADLNLQFGALDLNFDVEPAHGMRDILESTERVDDVLLQRIAFKRDRNLHLLPTGNSFDGFHDLSEADVDRLLEVARESSWNMVLDLPHHWSPWTKKVLVNADEIVITATPDLASLRNAKNMIEMLAKARPNDAPPKLVVNRVGTPGVREIKAKEFAEAVKASDWTSIPYDARLFSKASNEGRMVTETATATKAARALCELAYKVTGRREGRGKDRRRLRDRMFALVGGGKR